MGSDLTRRGLICGAASLASAALTGTPMAHAADRPRDIDWRDLVPAADGLDMSDLLKTGIVQHGELSTPFDQELGAELTTAFDGQLIRIPGYIVPLDFDGLGVTAFILVPYVGACIHVPPPPPNQLILVTTDKPYQSAGLFEAIYVTGQFSTAATQTALAQIGYEMQATDIVPYG